MNGYSALTNMPGEWQQWIADNIKQCCSTESMLPMLIRDGHFPAQVAYDAITEARAKLDGQTVRIDGSYVDSRLHELSQNEDLSRYIL